MNKQIFGILIAVVFVSAIPVSFAQNDIRVIDPALENPPDCDLVTFSGERAWIPFEIRTFYDFNRDAKMEDTQVGNSQPVITKTPQTYFFNTNQVDEYNIQFELQYENVKLRAIKVEVISAGNRIVEEVIPYTNGSFCKNFHIVTSEEPHLPTLEEAYGEAIVTMIEEVPNFVPAFQQSTINTSNAMLFIGLGLAVILLVVLAMFFIFMARKKTDKKQRENLESASLQVTDNLRKTDEMMEDVKTFQKTSMEKQENFISLMSVEFRQLLLNMKNDYGINAKKLQKEFADESEKLSKKKEELENQSKELETLLNVDDEGTLRSILNVVPTTNLQTLGRLLRDKNDNPSIKIKKILKEVFQRRSKTEVIKKKPKITQEEVDTDINDADTKTNSELKEELMAEEITVEPTREEIDEKFDESAEPVEEEPVEPVEEKTIDDVEEVETCTECKNEKHCNGTGVVDTELEEPDYSAEENQCECSCCFEDVDLDDTDWEQLYEKLDYEELRQEWIRINDLRTGDYMEEIEHNSRVGVIQKLLKALEDKKK